MRSVSGTPSDPMCWKRSLPPTVIVPKLRTETLSPLLPRKRCSMVTRPRSRSEFPRPLLGPALDHDLLLSEELDRIPALSVEIAEEALTRTAEREPSHRRGDSDVDAHIADFGFVAKFSRAGAARRKEARLIAVGAGVDKRDRLVDIRYTMYR